MVQLLLKKDSDYVHANPEKDRSGVYKKGYIIECRNDNSPIGGMELNKFAFTQITGLAKEDFYQYCVPWEFIIDYEVITSDPVIGGFRIKVFSTKTSITDQAVNNGFLTREMVENYLINWGAIVRTIALNDVRFDISVFLIGTSNGFWGVDVSGVNFIELKWNPGLKVDKISADYSGTVYTSEQVERVIIKRGGTVISNANGIVTYEIEQTDVLQRFKDDIAEKVRKVFYRRQYYITSGAVDAIINYMSTHPSEALEISLGDFNTYLRNRLDE